MEFVIQHQKGRTKKNLIVLKRGSIGVETTQNKTMNRAMLLVKIKKVYPRKSN
jgi:hypothetical protein